MAPWVLIGIAALIGTVWKGGTGFVAGALAGVAINLVLGFFVRKAQGGLLPRKVRRELIVNILRNFPDTVTGAFPGLQGDQLFDAMTKTIENVGRRAISFAPSNSDVWSAPVVAQALRAIMDEEDVLEMKTFYLAMSQQIARDWYTP